MAEKLEGKLQLQLVTPYKRVLSEDVEEVTAPGTVGELGILPGHTRITSYNVCYTKLLRVS